MFLTDKPLFLAFVRFSGVSEGWIIIHEKPDAQKITDISGLKFLCSAAY